MDLLPAGARLAPRTLSVIGHGELAGSSARSSGSALSQLSRPLPLRPRRRRHVARRDGRATPRRSADLAALESTQHQAARARRRPGLSPEPHCADRFVDGVELLQDGTELHLASFCLANAELRPGLAGTDDPAFAALKVKYADVIGGICRRTRHGG